MNTDKPKDNSGALLLFIAACAAVVIVATPAACMVHETYTFGQMVKAGADPVAVRCGMATPNNSVMCALAAMKASNP